MLGSFVCTSHTEPSNRIGRKPRLRREQDFLAIYCDDSPSDRADIDLRPFVHPPIHHYLKADISQGFAAIEDGHQFAFGR